MRSQTEKQDEQRLRSSSRELYGLLGALGERMYLEAMSLCDSEKEAAAWASANLVRSLEQHRLLARVAQVP